MDSDLLIICMIIGVSKSLQEFTSPAGNGSSAHCLFGEAGRMHWISCSVAGCRMSIGLMSTVHAALELTESISDSIDSKQHCAGVFIDLKKAFDTVNHKLLVEKSSFNGVRGFANRWLENYLMNRKQYVVVDNQASRMQFIKCGVP